MTLEGRAAVSWEFEDARRCCLSRPYLKTQEKSANLRTHSKKIEGKRSAGGERCELVGSLNAAEKREKGVSGP